MHKNNSVQDWLAGLEQALTADINDTSRQAALELGQAWHRHRQNLHHRLARALHRQGHKDQALALYQQGLQEQQNQPSYLLDFGKLLNDLGRLDDKIKLLKDGTARLPKAHELWQSLGNAYKLTNDLAQAQACYLQAAQLNHRNIGLLFQLSNLMVFGQLQQPWLDYLQAELDNDRQSASNKALAAFALGKVHLDQQQPERAFDFYQQANAWQLQGQSLRLQLSETMLTTLQTHMTPERLRRANPSPSLPEHASRQIFIVGMSRSGKTLVENILAKASEVRPRRESMQLVRFSRDVLNKRPMANLGRYLCALDAATFQAHQQRFWHYFPAHSGFQTFTMPWNINDLGLLGLYNPKARIVFIQRDPQDLGMACYFKPYGQGNLYASHLPSLGLQIRLYERLIQHWQASLPNPMLCLHYEQLVRQPSQTTEQLLDFCGLEHRQQHLQTQLQTAPKHALSPGLSLDQLSRISDQFVNSSHSFGQQLQPMMQAYEQGMG